jgi:hypothetical protein
LAENKDFAIDDSQEHETERRAIKWQVLGKRTGWPDSDQLQID